MSQAEPPLAALMFAAHPKRREKAREKRVIQIKLIKPISPHNAVVATYGGCAKYVNAARLLATYRRLFARDLGKPFTIGCDQEIQE